MIQARRAATALALGGFAFLLVGAAYATSRAGDSEYREGLALARGQGVSKDLEAAAKKFRAGADLWHPGSQYALARLYLKGAGVKKCRISGVSWLKHAAPPAGHAKARALLPKLGVEVPEISGPGAPLAGSGLTRGSDGRPIIDTATVVETMRDEMETSPPTPQELAMEPAVRSSLEHLNKIQNEQSVALLEQQAEQGIAWSAFHLGYLHEVGVVVEKDSSRARELYSKAARLGYPLAKVFAHQLGN